MPLCFCFPQQFFKFFEHEWEWIEVNLDFYALKARSTYDGLIRSRLLMRNQNMAGGVLEKPSMEMHETWMEVRSAATLFGWNENLQTAGRRLDNRPVRHGLLNWFPLSWMSRRYVVMHRQSLNLGLQFGRQQKLNGKVLKEWLHPFMSCGLIRVVAPWTWTADAGRRFKISSQRFNPIPSLKAKTEYHCEINRGIFFFWQETISKWWEQNITSASGRLPHLRPVWFPCFHRE